MAPATPTVRRVRRTLRSFETASVLKFSVLFWLCVVTVWVLACVLLWVGAGSVGVIDNIEKLMQDQGFDDFRFLPSRMLNGLLAGSVLLVLLGTFATVLMATIYNLISDVIGGIRVTVLEEELPRRRPPAAATTAPDAVDVTSTGNGDAPNGTAGQGKPGERTRSAV